MAIRNTFIKFAGVGAIVVMGIVALGVQQAYADDFPLVSPSISYSGNTITISGVYFSGDTRYQTSCGGIGIGVPLPEGAQFGTASYVTDDGKSGNSTAHTVTVPETYATCSANGGQGENGTFSFTFSDDTSVSHTGTLTVGFTVPVNAPIAGSSWIGVVTIPFTYGAPSGGGSGNDGTINVQSKNSYTGGGVPATWNFSPNNPAADIDPCSVGNCNNVSQGTYNGLVLDTYTINPIEGSAGPLYSFGGVEKTFAVANGSKEHGIFGSLLALGRDLGVPVANAVSFGSCGQTQPLSASSICGAPAFTANFTIIWNPVPAMSVSPSPVSLNSSSPSQTVTVTNSGAQGSQLDWTASAPTYSGSGSGWLTVSPTSGTLSNGVSGNASQSLTFTANPGALANGTYTATVTFNGSSGGGLSDVTPQIVTVNFTVTSAGPPAPPVGIVVSPSNPSEPVTTPITATCSGGSGSYTWSATGPVIAPSDTGSTYAFHYDAPGTYTVTCTDTNDPTNSASVPVTITQITPSCAFAANPNKIVPPGSSILSWTCVNAVSCTINNNPIANVASGTLPISITSTNTGVLTYVLACQGPGTGPGSTSSVSAQITVVQPGIIEGNP